MPPLSLSVSTGAQQEYRLIDSHLAVVKKFDYTCQYCGFKSVPCPDRNASPIELQGYMQVHSRSYSIDPSADDLECVCPFCYQALNLATVESPTFIYFPWCSQEQLNHLLIVIFSMIRMGIKDDSLSDQATKTYLKLLNYKNYVGQIHPSFADNPVELVQVLYWLAKEEPETYMNRDLVLNGIRLIPTKPPQCSGFQMHFTYWNTYKWYREDITKHWQSIYSDMLTKFDPVQAAA
jgi:hypothetical protein